MTSPTNNTPTNLHNWERGHVENVQPDRDRPPRSADTRRVLLDEDIEYDVWLEECLVYAQTLVDE
ncbi:MAG: hypothetical protein IH987_10005 [Planctomycetes bacterium]|nr:hypothetical protein [Planctomycetota bacterium]